MQQQHWKLGQGHQNLIRSPKPNQLFIMSQCYIHGNLVKIRQLVHEISCTQETVTLKLTPTGSTSKTICPPPLRWGNIMILNIRTDMSGQTWETWIRLLLKKQSDQSLKSVQFFLHLLEAWLYGQINFQNFRKMIISGIPTLTIVMVLISALTVRK